MKLMSTLKADNKKKSSKEISADIKKQKQLLKEARESLKKASHKFEEEIKELWDTVNNTKAFKGMESFAEEYTNNKDYYDQTDQPKEINQSWGILSIMRSQAL